jgi:hypothetical protein
VGTSFGCLALANSKTVWGLPSGSAKGWTPVAAMMRIFMAAVPRQLSRATSFRNWAFARAWLREALPKNL